MRKLLAFIFVVCFFCVEAQPPAYVPTSGLKGFWDFSGNANDVSLNGHNGTVNGASLTTDRFLSSNSAYLFNGTSNYISVPSATSLAGFTDMSISAWIQIDSLPSMTRAIVTKWYQVSCPGNASNADTYETALIVNAFQFATNNNNLTGFTSPPPISASLVNTWIHMVCTSHSTQGLSIYINGTLAATFATSGSICSSVNTLYFGADYDGNGSFFHRFFKGKIDDIGIWNRVITLCEIQQLYTSSLGPLSAISTVSTICSGSSATLIASGPGPYTWTPGGATTASVVVIPSSSTVYSVASACANTATVSVQVNPTPSLGVTVNPPLICSGSSATLTATGAATYSWVGIGTGSAIVINPTVQTTYTVLGNNGSCISTLIRVQNVLPVPSLTITSSDTTICAGDAVTLSANGANAYTWQPSGLTGPNVLVTPSVTTVYTVSGINNSGCIASATWTIFVTSGQPVTASANPTMVCPGNSATLSASGASTYTWQPGGSTGSSIVVNPLVNTTYTVYGASGSCFSNTVVSVTMGMDVAINPSGNLCNNNSIILSFSPASPATTGQWAGPGIAGSANGPSVIITAGGIYSVVATNTLNGCTGTASILVTSSVNPLNFSITPSTTLSCFPGSTLSLLVSSSANYNWLPATEVVPNSGPLVVVNPSVTSSYTAIAQLGSCTGTAVVTISVIPMPTVTAASSDATICAGKTLTLTASGASEYSWLPGNLSGSSVTLTPGMSTTYTVTGSNAGCASSYTLPVSVLENPQLTTTVFPLTICTGFSSTLSVSGAFNLAWLTGDPPPLSNTTVVSPTVTSTYTAIGTNLAGCSSSVVVQVNVIQSPVITAVSSNTSICAGETITLTAAGSSNYTWMPGQVFAPTIFVSPGSSTTYTVISDDPTCSHATVYVVVNDCVNRSLGITESAESPEQTGGDYYRIRFTVTANNASSSDLTHVLLNNDLLSTFPQPINYTVVNAPVISSKNSLLSPNSLFNGSSEPSLTAPLNSTLIANTRDTIVFTVLVQPNGFTGLLKNSVIGLATDYRNIIARDTSNNGFAFDPDNDGDPTNNNILTPIELEPIEFFIPEGFSPDGDGINDLFVIKGLNGRSAKFTVFNRWGTKVFTKEGTELNWDGKANVNAWGHDKLPASTYYYIFEFSERRSKVITGFIVLSY